MNTIAIPINAKIKNFVNLRSLSQNSTIAASSDIPFCSLFLSFFKYGTSSAISVAMSVDIDQYLLMRTQWSSIRNNVNLHSAIPAKQNNNSNKIRQVTSSCSMQILKQNAIIAAFKANIQLVIVHILPFVAEAVSSQYFIISK